MRIRQLFLKDYKPFEVSQYKKLNLYTTADVQLICARNGAGKSSLLKAMSPYPAKKSFFHKEGIKELYITHENNEYILRSDFKEKDHVHSFIKNDIELNISGLSTIQEDLIHRELGITSLVHDLMFNKFKFSQMSKNERKLHILNINPFDLIYFMDTHKKVCGKIRECKNNIKMLNERQAEIENKLANKSIVDTKVLEQQTLANLKMDLDKIVFTINQYINQYKTQLKSLEDSNIELTDVSNKIKELKPFLFKSLDFDLNTYVSHSEISSLKEVVQNLENNELWNLIKEIDTYSDQLKDISISEKLSGNDLEHKIKEYKNELINLQPKDELPCLHENDLMHYDDIYTEIKKLLNDFAGCQLDKFITEQQEYKLKTLGTHLTQKINIVLKEKQYCQESLHVSNTYIRHTLPQKIEDNCNNCGLYLEHAETLNAHKNDVIKFTQQIKNYDKRHTVLQNRLNILNAYSDKYVYFSKQYRTIYTMFDSLKIFSNEWLSNLHIVILRQPNKILSILETIHNNTINKQKSILMEKELNEFILSLDKIKLTNQTSKDFIEKILKDKLEQKDRLILNIDNQKYKIKTMTELLEFKNEHEQHLNELYYIQERLSIKEQRAGLVAIIKYYQKLEEYFIKILQHIDQDLRTLDIFLKEQHSLMDRYNLEILPLIKKAETEKQIHEDLELALSPSSGIPYKYLIKSINGYITAVNSIIKQVWYHPLEIELLTEHSELDFIFPIKVDDVIVPDISECSTGQRCMIDFAWNIAGIIGRKIQNYPLYLDEADDGLDTFHKQKFLELLKILIDNKVVSQLIMISHHALMFEGFSDSEILVLKEDNIVVPENVNKHVQFN